MHRSALILATAFAAYAAPLAPVVRAQPADTTGISHEPLFTAQDAWIAAGFAAATLAARPVDNYFAERLQNVRSKENRVLENMAAFFEWMGTPGPYYIGPALYGIGRIAKNRDMADLGLHGTEALYLGMGIVGLLKGAVGRARPLVEPRDPNNYGFGRGWKDDHYRSFPSGHALSGFAAAAAVTAETSRWWPEYRWLIGTVMYGGATGIAVSRMYHNKHWASDVIVGAAIGTFAGLKVVRYHHTHPNNRIDRWLLSATVVPGEPVRLGITVLPR